MLDDVQNTTVFEQAALTGSEEKFKPSQKRMSALGEDPRDHAYMKISRRLTWANEIGR